MGAFAANVTSVAPTGAGNLRLYAGDGTSPLTSALNFGADQTRANNGVFPLAGNGDGTLAIRATVTGGGTVHVVLDVTGYFTAPRVFVSAFGSDGNPGTAQAPFRTIARGIAAAVALGGAQAVLVGEGGYPEKVTLVEGISLLGGYHCTTLECTWAHDPRLYDTAIVNQDFEGVLAPYTVSRNTRLDGFRVVGMGGARGAAPGSAALTLRGGTPMITGNRILGGDVTGGASFASRRSIGIAILAPASAAQGALIDGNDIQGGASIENTSAILFDAAASSPGSTAPAVIVTNTMRARRRSGRPGRSPSARRRPSTQTASTWTRPTSAAIPARRPVAGSTA